MHARTNRRTDERTNTRTDEQTNADARRYNSYIKLKAGVGHDVFGILCDFTNEKRAAFIDSGVCRLACMCMRARMCTRGWTGGQVDVCAFMRAGVLVRACLHVGARVCVRVRACMRAWSALAKGFVAPEGSGGLKSLEPRHFG